MPHPGTRFRAILSVSLASAALLAFTAEQPTFAADNDKDGVSNEAETGCGGNPTNPNVRPERIDGHLLSRDDDGDQTMDEALPGGSASHDCDGDGFTGSAESYIFSPASGRDQDACGIDAWPLDFVSGGTPNSTNRVTITDLTTFVAPTRRINTSPNETGFSQRWDLIPGPGVFAEHINISDLTAMVSGAPGTPPMLAGPRAINGPSCPWPVGSSYGAAPVPNSTLPEAVALVPIPGTMNEAVVLTQHEEKVWRISLDGAFGPTLYGDLSGFVGGGGFEEGLLAFAFAPGFPTDNRVYAYYTQGSPQPSVLTRFNVVGGVVNVGSAQQLLSIPQPYQNHNGGQLAFGPDGYLYLSLGDGGGGGDPDETGQNNTDLLGSVLRIDVSGPTGYSVPASNPFAGATAGADEVWAYGFRNPWRFSFDTYTGDLWLADVGQGWWEEVDRVVAGGNYGWDVMEGPACHEPSSGCDQTGKILPVYSYNHSGGACSVTGGFVYHGSSMPELAGWYIYGDYCTGQIWALDVYGNKTNIQLVDVPYFVTSFGQTPNGEVYVVTPQNGIFRLMR